MVTIQGRKAALLKKATEDQRIFEERICNILITLSDNGSEQSAAVDYQALQAEVNSIFRQVLCAKELNLYYFLSDSMQEFEISGKEYYIASNVLSLLKILFNLKISIWAAENKIPEAAVKRITITNKSNAQDVLESILEYADFSLIVEELELDNKLSHLQSLSQSKELDRDFLSYPTDKISNVFNQSAYIGLKKLLETGITIAKL